VFKTNDENEKVGLSSNSMQHCLQSTFTDKWKKKSLI